MSAMDRLREAMQAERQAELTQQFESDPMVAEPAGDPMSYKLLSDALAGETSPTYRPSPTAQGLVEAASAPPAAPTDNPRVEVGKPVQTSQPGQELLPPPPPPENAPTGLPGPSTGPSVGGPAPSGLSEDERTRRLLGIPQETVEEKLYRNQQALNANAQATDALKAGEAREAEAKARRQAEAEAYMQAEKVRMEREAARAEALANHKARLQELEKLSVNEPDRFWNEHWAGPVFGRIGAAIAIGLASFGGQGQLAYKMISDGINRDIDAQRQRFEAKKQLAEKYGQLDQLSLKSYDDKLEDLERIRAIGLQASAQRLKDMASAMGDQERARTAQETVLKLQAEAAAADEKNTARVLQRMEQEAEKRRRAAAAQPSYVQQLINARRKGAIKGQEKLGEAQVTGFMPGTGRGGAAAAGGDELGPTARAGVTRIQKHISDWEPAWNKLDALADQGEAWSKRSKGKPGVVERLAALYASDPKSSPMAVAGAGTLTDADTMELARNAAAARAYFASATGGKAITYIEERLSVSKADLDQALTAIMSGEFTPKQVELLRKASAVLKEGAVGQGPPSAQEAVFKSREAAKKNAGRLEGK